MALKRCKECGLPLSLGRWLRWEDNGTIVQRLNPTFRVLLMEADFLDDIFSRIEEALGISVRHIVFEAQRSAAKVYIGNWLESPLGWALLIPGLKRFTVEQFNKLAMLFGLAHSQTVEYRPGRYGLTRMRNIYSLDLMAANVVGAFEALERTPYKHSWTLDGDSMLLRVEHTATVSDIAERMYLVFPPAYPGGRHFPRCRRCGVPSQLSYLHWHEDQGTIIDSRRNKRMNFMIEDVPGTVFREMRKELGDAVVPLIIQAQKESWLNYIGGLGLLQLPQGNPEDAYRKLLEELPFLGQGNPVYVMRKGDVLEVAVENPFSELLLAGSLAAFYEAVENLAPDVEIHMIEEGILNFKFTPKAEH